MRFWAQLEYYKDFFKSCFTQTLLFWETLHVQSWSSFCHLCADADSTLIEELVENLDKDECTRWEFSRFIEILNTKNIPP